MPLWAASKPTADPAANSACRTPCCRRPSGAGTPLMQGRRVITLLVPESLEGRPAVRDGVGAQNELSGGVGAGDGGMGADRERGPPFDSPSPIQDIEVRDIEPEASPPSPPRDLRITEVHRI